MQRGKQNKMLGSLGEDIAASFLFRYGYTIIERNWRCNFGESDIVAIENNELVFVEVKTRSNWNAGFGSEAVTAAKRQKYESIALCYISNHDSDPLIEGMFFRFDVVDIVITGDRLCTIKLFQNATGLA